MKVLVADKFPESGCRALGADGCEVLYDPELRDDALVSAVASSGAEVLIVRSTKVGRAVLEAGRLALVVRAGAGYDTIDVEAASSRGILVANCPGKNAIAVAELAFGLMLALDRRIPDGVADLRAGRWNKKEYSRARGLFGRTLGLLGLGGIGREMVPRARAFGMSVIAWSRSLTTERARVMEIERKDSPVAVAALSDIVSVHLALTPDTRQLLGQEFFCAMREGSYFINTSRAEVVTEQALERAVRERGIKAALDVFAGEPAGGSGTLAAAIFRLPGVIGTHHIGASTDQAQQATSQEAVRIILEYRATGHAPSVVNLAKKSPATHLLVVRHYDRVGVLAAVFERLKAAGINVEETENVVFEGARAAVARIKLDQAPSEDLLGSIRASTGDIIEATLLAL